MKFDKTQTGILITLIALLLLATPAFAGGWVVITLDALPGTIHAGEIVHVGFMVRQHGVRPTDDVAPTLTATNRETGERVRAEAEQVGETGHFEVSVVFPEAGVWEWQIGAPPFPQQSQFEPLTVLAAVTAETDSPLAAASSGRALLRWGGAGLIVLAAILALLGQRRRQEVIVPGSSA